ncbi:MAG: membrane dipeptidase [Lachnospiraceae bacterium]|nr:membrane dipeptidase [Lachnospiraceae bacterium]
MVPIVDFHCDTLYKLSATPDRFFLPAEHSRSHVSYEGLCSAGSVLQCFALFTDLFDDSFSSPISRLRKQLACFQKILNRSNGHFVQVRTAAELNACLSRKKIAALLTLEESSLSDDPLGLLPEFASLGIRIATLTWDYPNLLGTTALNVIPSQKQQTTNPFSSLTKLHSPHTGLTPLGHDFLAEAERLGILIDVSHLSDASFYDVASYSKKPFLATHSNARSICNHPRNLTDDMLRIIGERGGVIGLTLYEPYLISGPATPEELLNALVRHAKHILSVAGSDALVLGTDFDGIPGNGAVPDITQLYRLEKAFLKAGINSTAVEKIFYRNGIRFLTDNL